MLTKGKTWKLELGAHVLASERTRFRVWAPRCQHVDLKILCGPSAKMIPMQREKDGYYFVETGEAPAGTRYLYILDHEKERPDPISRYQPETVHGPSQVMDPNRYGWHDSKWKGIPHKELVFYELHVGTFTREGTFEAVISKLPYLKKLGVTCVEIMPVAQFPGKRNWGYDGVGLYAVQNSYGGPDGLKKLVDACHCQGLAFCLDVVYNHLGPEGNYLRDFGPYFSERYKTPWGEAINYDGEASEHVRRYIVENALYWVSEFHVDALRLDAIHGIYDFGTRHILEEIGDCVHEEAQRLGRPLYIIPESDLNESRIIRSKAGGGFGLDAQWSDDFHHSVHTILTGEEMGYYRDFSGLADLAKSIEEGFVYDGRYSNFRGKPHGDSTKDLAGEKFVVCIQNHDQVGNRAWGDRFGTLLSLEAQKLAGVMLLMSPYLPLIWMGQEYGEKAPFQYFVDHGDPGLVEAVRKGRKAEFVSFGWNEIPDPKDPSTFERSRLDWKKIRKKPHVFHWRLYRDLLCLRKSWGMLEEIKKEKTKVRFSEKEKWLSVEYTTSHGARKGILYSFLDLERTIPLPFSKNRFVEILNTEAKKYGGSVSRLRNKVHRKQILLRHFQAIAGQIR